MAANGMSSQPSHVSKRGHKDYCLPGTDDGLPAREVGVWAEEKYRRVGMYCEMFATGMKARWDARVYLDLYAGSGQSRLKNTKRLVLGSPLIALSIPDPFDRYILCEADNRAMAALRARVQRVSPAADVRYVSGDVNETLEQVIREIPQHGREHRVLSFCFVDPFSVGIQFNTIRRLAEGRAIDFLILLALGMDANRNIRSYVSAQSTRIGEFLGSPDWRARWDEAQKSGEDFIYFLAREYATAMERIGYLPTLPAEMHRVRSDLKNLPLYYLAFFSKHPLGKQFWKDVQKYSTDQFSLRL